MCDTREICETQNLSKSRIRFLPVELSVKSVRFDWFAASAIAQGTVR